MGVLDNLLARDEVERERRARELPPLEPIREEGVTPRVEPPPGFGQKPFRQRMFEGTMKVLRYTGIPQALGMTAEGIDRVDQAFRQGILTVSGKLPLDTFKKRWVDAFDGNLKLSGKEFLQYYFEASLMEELEQIPLIPGWYKEISTPLPRLAGDKPGKKPVVSLASAMGVTAEFFITPFAALSFTPAGAGEKIGRGLARVGIRSPFKNITRGVDAMVGTKTRNPVSALVNIIREPQHAMSKYPEIIGDFLDDRDKFIKLLNADGEAFEKLRAIARRPRLPGWMGRKLAPITGTHRNYSVEEERRILKYLMKLQPDDVIKATDREKELAEAILDVFEPKMQALAEMRHIGKWDRSQRLSQIFPPLVGRQSLPADIAQSWSYNTLGLLGLPLRAGRKLKWKEENLDLWTGVRDMVYVMDRKMVWNAKRPVKTTIRELLPGTGAGTLFPAEYRTRTVTRMEDVGSLLKWRVPDPKGTSGFRNPRIDALKMDASDKRYLISLINELQGKGRGRHILTLGEMHKRFAMEWENKLNGNRISKYFLDKTKKLVDPDRGYNLPEFSKPQIFAQLMTHNVVRSVLWGNLGAAIKNTSQLINEASVSGIPKTLKGMFRMMHPKWRKTALDEVGQEFRRVLVDESWGSNFGKLADDVFMAPFNAFENFARGTSFNVALDDFMRAKRIRNFEQLAKSGLQDEAVRYAVRHSVETNFLYGTLGRSPALAGPMLRPATTLLSYAPKYAEFWARSAKRDGSFIIRNLALNGWAIDVANKHAGIAAEEWLGWGFAPPFASVEGVPLATSPQLNFALDLAKGMFAAGDGRAEDAARHLRQASGAVGRITEPFGVPQFAQLFANGLIMTGVAPFPVVFVDKLGRTIRQRRTGEKESASGETWVPISKFDALKSHIFTTTIDKSRRDLQNMSREARLRVDKVLDKRVKEYVDAMQKQDEQSGQRMMEKAHELSSPISIGFGTTLRSTLFRPDQKTFYPTMDMIMNRVNRRIRNQILSRDLIAMLDSGFVEDVLWANYIDIILKAPPELARGLQQ